MQLSAHSGKTLKEDEGDYLDFNIDQMQIIRCSVTAYGMELHGKQSTLMAALITCLRMRVQELHQSLICQGGLPVHTGIAPHMTKKLSPQTNQMLVQQAFSKLLRRAAQVKTLSLSLGEIPSTSDLMFLFFRKPRKNFLTFRFVF